MFEFKLPDIGEGLTDAEIVIWHVALGDEVAVDQVVVEVETAKSIAIAPLLKAPGVAMMRAMCLLNTAIGTEVYMATLLSTSPATVAGLVPPMMAVRPRRSAVGTAKSVSVWIILSNLLVTRSATPGSTSILSAILSGRIYMVPGPEGQRSTSTLAS